jgi:hypothetical protein
VPSVKRRARSNQASRISVEDAVQATDRAAYLRQ